MGQSTYAADDTATYPDCPNDPHKLQWLVMNWRIPCTVDPEVDLAFNLFKDADLKATATATFDGSTLSDVVCDPGGVPDANACILDASVLGDELVITCLVDGYKDDGTFDANVTFELMVSGCGTFEKDQHTSCSQDIPIGVSLPLTTGQGTIMYPEGCGECLLPGSVGVCCIPVAGGTGCIILSQSECEAQGGEYSGDGTTCDPNPCTEFCCFPDGSCDELAVGQCDTQGGYVVDDCLDCMNVPIEERSWGEIKSRYSN